MLFGVTQSVGGAAVCSEDKAMVREAKVFSAQLMKASRFQGGRSGWLIRASG